MLIRSLAETLMLDAALCLLPIACATASPPSPGPINVVSSGATANAVWGVTDCTFPNNTLSNKLVCPSETFTSANSGNIFILDDGGGISGSQGTPWVGTISAISSASSTVTLTGTPTMVTPDTHVTSFTVSNAGSDYTFGDTETLTCGGSCIVAALGTNAVMQAMSASVLVHGSSSFTNTTCLVTLLDQTTLGGQQTSLSVSFNVMTGIASATVLTRGLITGTTASQASGGGYMERIHNQYGSSTGTLAIHYGVVLEQLTQPGIFAGATAPCNASTATSMQGSGHGSGLTVFCPTNFQTTASWGYDNTSAFQSALSTMNADSAIGQPRPIYVPAGNYLTRPLNNIGSSGGTNNLALGYGAWIGDEHNHSNIFVIPATITSSTPQDVFAWVDSTMDGSKPQFGNTWTFSDKVHGNAGGSAFRNLTVIGDRSSMTEQNALRMYGTTTYFSMDNVVVSYMRGNAFGAGYADTGNMWGNIIESRLANAQFDHDGDAPPSGSPYALVPTVDITAVNQEGSNNIDILNLSIASSFGPGIWLHQGNLGGTQTNFTRGFHILNAKVDGSGTSLLGGTLAPGDLVLMDDPNPANGITHGLDNILCRNLDLLNPPLYAAALHVAGFAPGGATRIDCEGSIRSAATTLGAGSTIQDYGRGLEVDGCTQCSFREAANTTVDDNLLIGVPNGTPQACASATAGNAVLGQPGLIYNGNGAEYALTTCVDPLSLNLIAFPGRQLLGNGNVANTYPSPPIAQTTSTISTSGSTTLHFGTANSPAFLPSPNASLWTMVRSGNQAGAFTDTLDSATNIITGIDPGNAFVQIGQIYHFRICNTTSYPETIAAGSSVSISGSTTVAAGSCTNFAMSVVGTSTSSSLSINGG